MIAMCAARPALIAVVVIFRTNLEVDVRQKRISGPFSNHFDGRIHGTLEPTC